jgi:ABC-type transporter Mla subunit MlaD
MPAGEEAGATKEGELERWRAQARALADSNDALRTAARSQTGTAAQLEQLKNRIRLFLDRLAASKLTPEEQALVAAELPPQ